MYILTTHILSALLQYLTNANYMTLFDALLNPDQNVMLSAAYVINLAFVFITMGIIWYSNLDYKLHFYIRLFGLYGINELYYGKVACMFYVFYELTALIYMYKLLGPIKFDAAVAKICCDFTEKQVNVMYTDLNDKTETITSAFQKQLDIVHAGLNAEREHSTEMFNSYSEACQNQAKCITMDHELIEMQAKNIEKITQKLVVLKLEMDNMAKENAIHSRAILAFRDDDMQRSKSMSKIAADLRAFETRFTTELDNLEQIHNILDQLANDFVKYDANLRKDIMNGIELLQRSICDHLDKVTNSIQLKEMVDHAIANRPTTCKSADIRTYFKPLLEATCAEIIAN